MGQVTGPDDRPVAGAVVRIWPQELPDTIATRTTDEEGRWRAPGLAVGRWEIEISAEGYLPAEGWFQVTPARPSATVDVALRSLDETPPSFAENATTVLRWIERGNALLAQGDSAQARAEYERALPLVERGQRPEILQAMARTHFVEGDTELAIARLQQAVGIDPENAQLRQLFVGVLDSVGRGDEAEALIVKATDVAEIDPQPTAMPARQLPPQSPLLEATPGRTGRFRTVLPERSPLSAIEVYRGRYGLSDADLRATDPAGGEYDLADESFELYVPESYADGDAHGLFVWVSPTPYGGFGNPEFERLLAERKLIWIGANNSGNGRWGWYRVGLALDAVHNASRLYSIDPQRIYVAGYSGGGRISSQASMLYPEVFSGGLFVYGCDYFEQLPVPDRPGSLWPARFAAPSKVAQERLRSESRFVLLTGDRDFNRAQTKAIHKRMTADGFEHLTYLQIPDADHYFGLPPEWFEKALDALDEPLVER